MMLYKNAVGDWIQQLPDGTTVNLRTGNVEVLGDAWKCDTDLLAGRISKGEAIERATECAQQFATERMWR